MATFCMSQCQDGRKVFFKNVMNEDVRALKDTIENFISQMSCHIKKDSIRYFFEKNSGNYKLKL